MKWLHIFIYIYTKNPLYIILNFKFINEAKCRFLISQAWMTSHIFSQRRQGGKQWITDYDSVEKRKKKKECTDSSSCLHSISYRFRAVHFTTVVVLNLTIVTEFIYIWDWNRNERKLSFVWAFHHWGRVIFKFIYPDWVNKSNDFLHLEIIIPRKN